MTTAWHVFFFFGVKVSNLVPRPNDSNTYLFWALLLTKTDQTWQQLIPVTSYHLLQTVNRRQHLHILTMQA